MDTSYIQNRQQLIKSSISNAFSLQVTDKKDILEKGGKKAFTGEKRSWDGGKTWHMKVVERQPDGSFWKKCTSPKEGEEGEKVHQSNTEETPITPTTPQKDRTKVSVEDRWGNYETMSSMVVDGSHKSMIAYGTGGVGKSFSIFGKDKVLDQEKMIPFNDDQDIPGSDSYDYIKITGKNTPTDLWKNLYNHNGKLLIFDDCDSVLTNPEVQGFLKGALDSTGDGTIEYKQIRIGTGDDAEFIPKRFRFKGRVIFITNLDKKNFEGGGSLQPLKSRSMIVDLSMNKDETIQRTRNIMNSGWKVTNVDGTEIEGIDKSIQKKAIDFLEDHKDEVEIGDFNMRTLGNICKCIVKSNKLGKDWRVLASTNLGLSSFNSDFEKAMKSHILELKYILDL